MQPIRFYFYYDFAMSYSYFTERFAAKCCLKLCQLLARSLCFLYCSNASLCFIWTFHMSMIVPLDLLILSIFYILAYSDLFENWSFYLSLWVISIIDYQTLHIIFLLLLSNHQSNRLVDENLDFGLFFNLFSFFNFADIIAYLAWVWAFLFFCKMHNDLKKMD